MKLKQLIIAIAVLAAIAAIAHYAQKDRGGAQKNPLVGEKLLPPDKLKAAVQVEITKEGEDEPLVLEKKPDGTWVVPGYHGLPIDFGRLKRLMDDLQEAEILRAVTRKPEKIKDLEFGKDHIVLKQGDKTLWQVETGKRAESSGTFVRLDKGEEALLADLSLWVDANQQNWAQKKPLDFEAVEVEEISLSFPGGETLKFKREKEGAEFTSPDLGPDQKVRQAKVTGLVDLLLGARFTKVVEDTASEKDAADAKENTRTVKVRRFNGDVATVEIGRRPAAPKPPEAIENAAAGGNAGISKPAIPVAAAGGTTSSGGGNAPAAPAKLEAQRTAPTTLPGVPVPPIASGNATPKPKVRTEASITFDQDGNILTEEEIQRRIAEAKAKKAADAAAKAAAEAAAKEAAEGGEGDTDSDKEEGDAHQDDAEGEGEGEDHNDTDGAADGGCGADEPDAGEDGDEDADGAGEPGEDSDTEETSAQSTLEQFEAARAAARAQAAEVDESLKKAAGEAANKAKSEVGNAAQAATEAAEKAGEILEATVGATVKATAGASVKVVENAGGSDDAAAPGAPTPLVPPAPPALPGPLSLPTAGGAGAADTDEDEPEMTEPGPVYGFYTFSDPESHWQGIAAPKAVALPARIFEDLPATREDLIETETPPPPPPAGDDDESK